MNVLERMAALIREDPAITVAEIARRLGYSEEKSVYYWLEKARVKGIREFKRMVLTEHLTRPSPPLRPPEQEVQGEGGKAAEPPTPSGVEPSPREVTSYSRGDDWTPKIPSGVEAIKEKTRGADMTPSLRALVEGVETSPRRPAAVSLPLIHEPDLLWITTSGERPPQEVKPGQKKAVGQQRTRVYLPSRPGVRSFALKLLSDTMKPLFLPGDILVIDPDAPLNPGSLVLGRRGTQMPRPFVASRARDVRVLVDALNASFVSTIEEVEEGDISIIGIVVALVRYY